MCWKKVRYLSYYIWWQELSLLHGNFVTVVFIFACKLHIRVSQPMYVRNATLPFTEKLELCEVWVCLVGSEFCSALLNLSLTYPTSKLLPAFCSADAQSYPSSKCSLYLPIIYLCNNTYRLENNGHYVLHGRALAPETDVISEDLQIPVMKHACRWKYSV